MYLSVVTFIFFLLTNGPVIYFFRLATVAFSLMLRMPKIPVARRSSVRSANPFLSTREEFCFYLLAVKKNLSGAARRYAEDLLKKLCSARSVKSGDTEYLSPVCLEGHISEICIFAAEVFDFQQHIADLVILFG